MRVHGGCLTSTHGRGPDDLEDHPTTTNVVMPPVAEVTETPDLTAEDTPHLPDDAASRIYARMPESPHDMPLLAGHASRRGSLAPPAVPFRVRSRRAGLRN